MEAARAGGGAAANGAGSRARAAIGVKRHGRLGVGPSGGLDASRGAGIGHQREKKGARDAERNNRGEQGERVARQRRFGPHEARHVEAQRIEAHPCHGRVMHAGNRETERDRAEEQPRPGRSAVDRPQGEGARGDRHRDRGDDIGRHVGGRSGKVHRRHADIVHEADAETHRERARGDAKRRRPGGVGGVDAYADHNDADEKRDQRRQHQVVDGAGEIGGEHPDEVHRPDAGR